jgi:hypothetical protein
VNLLTQMYTTLTRHVDQQAAGGWNHGQHQIGSLFTPLADR